MRVGDMVRYKKWHGIVTSTKGKKLKKDEEVMVRWHGERSCSWEQVCLLEIVSEGG